MSPVLLTLRSVLFCIAAVVLFTGVAAAAPMPPASVMAVLGEDAVGPDSPRFSSADISPDGVADWVADFSDRLAWCGSGGCRQVVIASRPGGGYAVAFDEQTREFELRRPTGQAVLDVEIYGAWCGEAGVTDCRRRFLWSEAEGRFVERPNAAGETRLHGPLFQVVPATIPAGQDPGPCGGQAASVPDLDGDGLRDLVVQSDACEGQGALTRVWISGGPGRFAATWPGDEYGVDISAQPARLMAPSASCAEASGCALVSLAWDGPSESFKAVSP